MNGEITLCRIFMPMPSWHFFHKRKMQFRKNSYVPNDIPLSRECITTSVLMCFTCKVRYLPLKFIFHRKMIIPTRRNDSPTGNIGNTIGYFKHSRGIIHVFPI